jgi:hypothetical protein
MAVTVVTGEVMAAVSEAISEEAISEAVTSWCYLLLVELEE